MEQEKAVIKHLALFFAASLIVVIGSYILNFRSGSVSSSPSDWGVLGDYFGGILNPLISLMALFFLTKTYISQKEELQQSEAAAKQQLKNSQIAINMQLLNTKISASYEVIALYRGEMEGVTIAINAPGNGRSYTGIDGRVRFSDDEQKSYRSLMAAKITKELENIEKYLKEIQHLADSNAETL